MNRYFIYTIGVFVFLNVILFSQETLQKPGISIKRTDNRYEVTVTVILNNNSTFPLRPNEELKLELPSGQHRIVVDYEYKGGSGGKKYADFTVNNDIHFYTVHHGVNWYDLSLGRTKIVTLQSGSDYNAIQNSYKTLSQNIPKGSKIAIINIDSNDEDEGIFFIEEITIAFVNSNYYIVVDRRTLDTILKEQKFQMTGFVDEESIVSIGKFIGADVVLTGSISGTGGRKRLRFIALDVKTAQILAMSSESI